MVKKLDINIGFMEFETLLNFCTKNTKYYFLFLIFKYLQIYQKAYFYEYYFTSIYNEIPLTILINLFYL